MAVPFLRVKQTRFAGRRLKVVVPYGSNSNRRKSISNHSCFPLWGEWILRAKRVKDERGLVHQKHCEHQTSFSLITSIGLTSISFRQPTFPKGESKNILKQVRKRTFRLSHNFLLKTAGYFSYILLP